MSALRFRVGRWLRATARPTLLLTITLAALTTIVLATAVGARRTSTAPDRFTASFGDAPTLGAYQNEPGRPPTAEISALPGVRAARSITFVFGVVGLPDRGTMLDTLVFSGSPSAVGARLIAGREPDPATPGEFVATRGVSTTGGLSIGDKVRLTTISRASAEQFGYDPEHLDGPSFDGVLVGLIEYPSEIDDPTTVSIFSPALLDDPTIGLSASRIGIWLEPGVTAEELRPQLDTVPGGTLLGLEPTPIVSVATSRAVRAQALGLWILAGIAAVASVTALGQLLARHVRLRPDESASLSALGYSHAQLRAEAAARATVVAGAAVVVAIVGSVALSGAFPFGFVRRLESDPGLRVDSVWLLSGSLVLMIGFVGWVALATRTPATRAEVHRLPMIDSLATRCPGSAMGHGLRFAFSSGRGESKAVAAALGGSILIVAGLVGSLTFAVSLQHLIDDPIRFGAGFDFVVDNGAEQVPASLLDIVQSDPDVESVTLYMSGFARVGQLTLPISGMDEVRGRLTPALISGRLPVTADEIALGRVSARQLHVSVGDEITLANDAGSGAFVITGLVVPTGIGGNDVVGQGGVVTADGYGRLQPDAIPSAAVIRLRSGAPAGTAMRIGADAGIPFDEGEGAPTRPPAIVNVARITFVPFALAGLLATLGALTLLNAAYTAVRRRDHQIAVLRSLGADRNWLLRAATWQAVTFALVPITVGAPLGFLAGRDVFRSFAVSIGGLADVAVPVGFAATALGALLVVGLLAALTAAVRSRRIAPAALLRTG